MRPSPNSEWALFSRAVLPTRWLTAHHAGLALGVLAVAGYLCLANLDNAALWHDEAPELGAHACPAPDAGNGPRRHRADP